MIRIFILVYLIRQIKQQNIQLRQHQTMESSLKIELAHASSSIMSNRHKKPLSNFRVGSGYLSGSKNSRYNNPEFQLLRLPSLDKRPTYSVLLTSDRNTKFKLESLEEKLQELSAEVHNTRLEANETMKNIQYTKQLLVQNHLAKNKSELKQKIDDLSKLIQVTKKTNQNRFQYLREGYNNLWNQTQMLRQNMFELTLRMDKIQNNLGYNQALNY